MFGLPAVFVCENNFYGEFTPMASVTAGGEIAAAQRSFGMRSRLVDGNDLWAVREAAAEAVDRARAGDGPTLLECQTYRHYGHSKSDPGKYRPSEEVERWLARDPLDLAPRAPARPRAQCPRRSCEGGRSATRWTAPSRARLPPALPRSRRDAGYGVRGMSELEFRTAIRDALAEELERDPAVVFFGEDVAAPGGVFAVTTGLHERFGDERVFDTPISELAMAGAAFGAAVTGLRPVIEIMFGDFMALPMDSS